jgi:glycosyltransferase involved in cell wall biosynthesis
VRRIAVVIRSLAVGGAEKQAVLMTRALARNHDVRLVVTLATPCEHVHLDALRAAEIPVSFLRGTPVSKLSRLAAQLARERVEIVFSHLPGDTLLAALAGLRAGVPLRFGGIRNTQMPVHKWQVLRWLHAHALTGSISNSYAARDVFTARGFDPARLHVLPNGIELPARPPSRGGRSAVVEIVSVGRLVAQKDHPTALAAIAWLRAHVGERLRFTIVGNGPEERRVRAAIREGGLAGCAELVTDSDRAADAYARADVHLSASRFEGLSNTVMEAMAHALPIVATDVGDNARLVREGENGHLVAPGDARALAERLAPLIDSAELRERQGARSFERIRHYDFDGFAKRVLEFVDALP